MGRSYTRKNDLRAVSEKVIQAYSDTPLPERYLKNPFTVVRKQSEDESPKGNGAAVDWFAWRFNAIALLVEMSPSAPWSHFEHFGFHLPEESIDEACRNQFAALTVLADYVIEKYSGK